MATPAHTEVSQLLVEWGQGDQEALGRLMPLVYDERRRLASRNLRRERPDHTLQTTALAWADRRGHSQIASLHRARGAVR